MVMFKINNVDYSGNVLADGSYQVNDDDVVKTWTNANEVKRAKYVRTKAKGSFQMFFETLAEYEQFLSDLNAAKNITTRAVECTIAINFPYNNIKTINADIELKPSRRVDGSFNDFFNKFTVNVEER